jgi:hypothetical protein
MAGRKRNRDTGAGKDRPREIPLTDLEDEEEILPGHGGHDIHAAGTPGGGSAVGGLAGTTVGHGDPDNADLEDAMGAGIHDTAEAAEDEDELLSELGGAAGGAVGGTPAGLRATGGNIHKGLAPGGSHRGDSTIGASPDNAP